MNIRLPNKTWLIRECIYRAIMLMYDIDIDGTEKDYFNHD